MGLSDGGVMWSETDFGDAPAERIATSEEALRARLDSRYIRQQNVAEATHEATHGLAAPRLWGTGAWAAPWLLCAAPGGPAPSRPLCGLPSPHTVLFNMPAQPSLPPRRYGDASWPANIRSMAEATVLGDVVESTVSELPVSWRLSLTLTLTLSLSLCLTLTLTPTLTLTVTLTLTR